MSKAKMTAEFCDNPICGYSEMIGNERSDGATGYHFGRGWYLLAGEGPIPTFYAHQEACILPALKAVMDN